jgi:hypothetical protein
MVTLSPLTGVERGDADPRGVERRRRRDGARTGDGHELPAVMVPTPGA